jgi:hypothetical protein
VASIQTLERRILALEARLADLEGGHGKTLYQLPRASVKNYLRWGRMLEHLKIDDVSEDDVDAVLDEQ